MSYNHPMTHETETSAPGSETAQYATLTDYFEAKLLHQAGRLDGEFHKLLDEANTDTHMDCKAIHYTNAFKSHKYFHDSLKTLRQLETARDTKRDTK